MAAGIVSCGKDAAPVSEERFALGTLCRITVWGGGGLAPAWEAVGEAERTLSARDPSSELSGLNRSAGAWTEVSPLLWEALELALDLARRTDGAFNPALGAATALWGIGTENQRVPSPEELEEAMKASDWTSVQMDDSSGRRLVRLSNPAVRLDLGAIGKGLAADKAAEALASRGVESALLNFGGNIRCLGSKPGGAPFRIGIRTPFAEAQEYDRTVEVSDLSVVTSGPYEKFFIDADGILRHHILDGRTGVPASSGLGSATVVGDGGALCDGLATACYVLGEEKGRKLLEAWPGFEAVFLPLPEGIRL